VADSNCILLVSQILIMLNGMGFILGKEQLCCQGLGCSAFLKELVWIWRIEYMIFILFIVNFVSYSYPHAILYSCLFASLII